MHHFEIGRAGGYAGELASPDPARNDTAIVATCTGPGQMHTARGLGSATRRHAIGRKNWLFSQQPARRHRKRTVIQLDRDGESQRAREAREPYWYLRELFEKLPLARTDYLALLPTARPPQPAP